MTTPPPKPKAQGPKILLIVLGVLFGVIAVGVIAFMMLLGAFEHATSPKTDNANDEKAFVTVINTTTRDQGRASFGSKSGGHGLFVAEDWAYTGHYQETVHGHLVNAQIKAYSSELGDLTDFNPAVADSLVEFAPWQYFPQFIKFQKKAIAGFKATGVPAGLRFEQAPRDEQKRPYDFDAQGFMMQIDDRDLVVKAAENAWAVKAKPVWAGIGNLTPEQVFGPLKVLATDVASPHSHPNREPADHQNYFVFHVMAPLTTKKAQAASALKPFIERAGSRLAVGQPVTMPDGRYRVHGALTDSKFYVPWYWFQVKDGKVLQFQYYYDDTNDSYLYVK